MAGGPAPTKLKKEKKVKKQKKEARKPFVSGAKTESRVKKLLADFPNDFKAGDLKDAYEKAYGQPLVFTAGLREKVCRPWKQGILINNCRVNRRVKSS